MAFAEDVIVVLLVAIAVGVAIYLVLLGRIKTVQLKFETIAASVKQWTDWL